MDDPLEFLHGLLSFKLLPEGPFSCQRGGGGGRYKCLVVAFHAYTANVEKVM